MLMEIPFISLCIPAYKRPALLKKLLDSVCAQTFRDFELLINDNSPDDSVKELVNDFAGRLTISYQKNIPAVSAVENCILLMRRARAPWIKIMHDDDWFTHKNALAVFAEAAKHSGKDFLFCATNRVRLDGHETTEEFFTGKRKKILEDSLFGLLYSNVIGHPSAVMHRKDNNIEYDPSFNWVLDIDFYMRYIEAQKGFHYIPEKLVNIGVGPGQETNKYHKNPLVEIPEYFRLLEKYDPGLPLKEINVFHMIWTMIARFRIQSREQITELGFAGRMPGGLDEMIEYQKRIPRIVLKQPAWSAVFMRRCYKKMAKA